MQTFRNLIMWKQINTPYKGVVGGEYKAITHHIVEINAFQKNSYIIELCVGEINGIVYFKCHIKYTCRLTVLYCTNRALFAHVQTNGLQRAKHYN